MTEADWLASTDPQLMFEFVRRRLSKRKLRLLAAGTCRAFRPNKRGQASAVSDERSSEAVTTIADFKAANDAAWVAFLTAGKPVAWTARLAAKAIASLVPSSTYVEVEALSAAASRDRAVLLRDIIGNPFRPPSRPQRLPPVAIQTAAQIYDRRDFSRMPGLADLVETSGAIDSDLLDHLRGPGPHTHGCWALDLVLGKV